MLAFQRQVTAHVDGDFFSAGLRAGKPNPLSQLTLKGRWLEPLGFTTGQRIEVITEPGQLSTRH
ncbi:TPA: type I toxin-antitoxin system SymE family toxin [Serratia marcescens]|nr:type I toxin-antitoxin system SymE family toxin [Serratia marcescens]HAT3746961.1 type I toxin-antitoxin system SymE family toxin [Serratia marcescens]HAT3783012.1 type I toxin-antitoxin system SymE family toxin [Serratia marcescens]HAT3787200.1 type I toxin-antitoxin system SymE family toxin [Serratia marcescens]HAT3797306.1 type I toxin-antitoxin system SymE family toxin [Serratia marcescens]